MFFRRSSKSHSSTSTLSPKKKKKMVKVVSFSDDVTTIKDTLYRQRCDNPPALWYTRNEYEEFRKQHDMTAERITSHLPLSCLEEACGVETREYIVRKQAVAKASRDAVFLYQHIQKLSGKADSMILAEKYMRFTIPCQSIANNRAVIVEDRSIHIARQKWSKVENNLKEAREGAKTKTGSRRSSLHRSFSLSARRLSKRLSLPSPKTSAPSPAGTTRRALSTSRLP